MTLQELPVLQGSDEWAAARRGMLTASVIGTIITPSTIKPANNMHSRALAALIAAERITGWTDPAFVSDDMERGWGDEPDAINVYSEHFAPVTVAGFLVEDRWGFGLGYSPDGLVGTDGLVEVKSRRPKKHVQTVLEDRVPPENVAQIQCGLLVSGREWCDYLSYSAGMSLWRKRVHADQRWQDAIVTAATVFEHAVVEMTNQYQRAVEGLPMTEPAPDYSHVELKL